jgi:hypothetical protein
LQNVVFVVKAEAMRDQCCCNCLMLSLLSDGSGTRY